jgi:hypothetical protein
VHDLASRRGAHAYVYVRSLRTVKGRSRQRGCQQLSWMSDTANSESPIVTAPMASPASVTRSIGAHGWGSWGGRIGPKRA